MSDRPFNVLFLGSGNSARSILAEQLLNHWGAGQFRGFSAGSHPKGEVHPIALELLQQMKLSTEGLRSKSWDEFAVPGAPPMDFVFTVCDTAAGEVCPSWPGQPITAHWGVEDPTAGHGSDVDKGLAFHKAFRELESRVKIFTSLPIRALDREKLEACIQAIGAAPTPESVH
jgi:arsenate reductase